ncbi:Cmx/CmrA family chloramphenicol efflux MFS transporter [Streptomyces sp. XD-27]|uniref:Cmx/CmrA family chloramphenicol efflux MFS transporter n=1 Tax=Streptomyces sp. XD-27 TaxID=3062779 RepID=UPI0026F420A6|nr:Cmx/CmrA family chloramphenicol efflux MFS transporter [Streptomyces sp. XD-27]WKX72304.1 MFS transporter [Streptomyces sp. XD-27]
MPVAVYILGLGIFAQGTSEFMLSGLLPSLADDLGVSVPDAGLLISAFAVGMIVGAPLLAVATLRWPRRTALVVFEAVFAAGHVVAALAPGYGVLLATRVVSAIAYAGFWAVAAVTAVSLAPAGAKGRAMAVVSSGLSAATVVGVPAGTFLGQHAGWRAAFWAVAALTVLSLTAVLAVLPGGRGTEAAPPALGRELGALRRGRLWLAFGTTALSFGAVMASFGYLGALLEETSGIAEGWVPAVLSLFGLGAFAGLSVGGRMVDARPYLTHVIGLSGLVAVSAALGLTATSAPTAVTLVFLLGLAGFLTQPALAARVFTIAGDAPTLAGALNTSAFNVGITAAPLLGGLAIGTGRDYASVAWVGAGLAALALVAVALAARLDGRAVSTADGGAVSAVDGGVVSTVAGSADSAVDGEAGWTETRTPGRTPQRSKAPASASST